MSIKRILSFVMAALLVLLCSCSNTGKNTDSTPSASSNQTADVTPEITLLYSQSDSVNPYKAETVINRKLSTLMYDSLIRLDSGFQPQRLLAESITQDKEVYTVTLKNAVFSDGSPVTADDVVFSLKCALESEYTGYKSQLSNIKSYKAEDSSTVKITLLKADPYFTNLLDFPIIKKNSDELKDENKIALPPIGSGRYVFDVESKTLKLNPSYTDKTLSVKEIKLINAPDSAVIKHNLESGYISIYNSDLSDGVVPPMNGNTSLTALNNFVYLGINLKNTYLKTAEMRYAIAWSIDRTAICNDAYFSFATPALGLFNSAWSDTGSLQNLSNTADAENVVAILEKIGYNRKDEEGFLLNSKDKQITFKLVAFKDNAARMKAAEAVKQQLEAVGFKINLVALDWDGYTSALANGNFDLYIAETKLNNNMDVSELLTSNGALSYGIPDPTPAATEKPNDKNDTQKATEGKNDGKSETDKKPEFVSSVPLCDTAVEGFYSGESSLVDIINAFNAEMPIVPLCYRQGVTVTNPALDSTTMSSVSDVYFGIENIK